MLSHYSFSTPLSRLPTRRWQSTSNPDGEFTTIVDDASVVLHYTYSYMSDVEQKAHRSCPDEYLAAARAGDKSKLHECFVIQTDQDAYIAAATGPEAVRDFFYSRFVLSEGVSVACRDPDLSMKARGRLVGWMCGNARWLGPLCRQGCLGHALMLGQHHLSCSSQLAAFDVYRKLCPRAHKYQTLLTPNPLQRPCRVGAR